MRDLTSAVVKSGENDWIRLLWSNPGCHLRSCVPFSKLLNPAIPGKNSPAKWNIKVLSEMIYTIHAWQVENTLMQLLVT